MKRLAILGLTALALVSGACGGSDPKTSFDVAAAKCGTKNLTFQIGAAQSGYNGKGPGWDAYKTSDGREVTVFEYGDGTWGWAGNGGCSVPGPDDPGKKAVDESCAEGILPASYCAGR